MTKIKIKDTAAPPVRARGRSDVTAAKQHGTAPTHAPRRVQQCREGEKLRLAPPPPPPPPLPQADTLRALTFPHRHLPCPPARSPARPPHRNQKIVNISRLASQTRRQSSHNPPRIRITAPDPTRAIVLQGQQRTRLLYTTRKATWFFF